MACPSLLITPQTAHRVCYSVFVKYDMSDTQGLPRTDRWPPNLVLNLTPPTIKC